MKNSLENFFNQIKIDKWLKALKNERKNKSR